MRKFKEWIELKEGNAKLVFTSDADHRAKKELGAVGIAHCPKCNKKMQVSKEMHNKIIRCPHCKSPFRLH